MSSRWRQPLPSKVNRGATPHHRNRFHLSYAHVSMGRVQQLFLCVPEYRHLSPAGKFEAYVRAGSAPNQDNYSASSQATDPPRGPLTCLAASLIRHLCPTCSFLAPCEPLDVSRLIEPLSLGQGTSVEIMDVELLIRSAMRMLSVLKHPHRNQWEGARGDVGGSMYALQSVAELRADRTLMTELATSEGLSGSTPADLTLVDALGTATSEGGLSSMGAEVDGNTATLFTIGVSAFRDGGTNAQRPRHAHSLIAKTPIA